MNKERISICPVCNGRGRTDQFNLLCDYCEGKGTYKITEIYTPIKNLVKDKDIVLIDDTIISGITLKQIISMLRESIKNLDESDNKMRLKIIN